MTTEPENVAQTVRDMMADTADCTLVYDPPPGLLFSAPMLVSVPNGRNIQNQTEAMRTAATYLKPARRKGTAKLATLQGLIDWANRFKSDRSALYANPDTASPSLTCIANYHGAGPAVIDFGGGDPSAEHCDHRGIYTFPVSKEWQRWIKVSGQALDKADMGQFIEDNAKDFLDPSPILLGQKATGDAELWEARLIEIAQKLDGRFGQHIKLIQMSRAFQVHETSNLTVSANRDTGESTIAFTNEHRDADGQPLQIPNLFLIAIPVFESGAIYRLPIRFQYRKSGAAVKFVLTVYDPMRAFDDAFGEAITIATESTGMPCFSGTPEA